MKVRCKYCDSFIDEYEEKCPNCGSTNVELKRVGEGVPKTIEELKQWYVDHNLPDENTTRFFIGKDIKEARAFGIYYDEFTGNYIVYKNKDSGERAVRYEGKDQTYAVNELYLKLKEEIQNQKNRNYNKSNDISTNNALFYIHLFGVFASFIFLNFNWMAPVFLFLSFNPGIFIMGFITKFIKNKDIAKKVENLWHVLSLAIFLLLLILPGSINSYVHRNDAYYKNNNNYFYNYGNDWYYYNNGIWEDYVGETSDFEYVDDSYSARYNFSNFEDSSYYGKDEFWKSSSSSSSSSDSWDSSSTWDSNDSWDSGGTDWSSDW